MSAPQVSPREPVLKKILSPLPVWRDLSRAQFRIRGARVEGTIDEWLVSRGHGHLNEMLGMLIADMRKRDPFVRRYERDAEIEIHPVFTLNFLEQLSFPEGS